MAPSLQGLNLIHPSPPPSADHDLVSNVPDVSAAQLDFWANFNFTNEDGPLSDKSAKSYSDKSESPLLGVAQQQQSFPQLTGQQPIDIGTLLYAIQQQQQVQQQQQQQQQQQFAPQQLANLLALQGFAQQQQLQQLQLPPLQPTLPRSTPLQAPSTTTQPPPPKRQRTTSTAAPPTPAATASVGPPLSGEASVAAAEDKRRRNTAASARFRMKKKEREAALEGKAKELEDRVGELERECETLRRENDWLKGLVVGVTGSVAPQGASGTNYNSGGKRARDD
ncbi:hypothetical protein BD626DRAFT_630490 [Schizophyllum amplum]|uniref:BZIP domain-containing protein n=1 Tax=Schizophyllum amplum TaxID=97359 RepID=A0A550CDE3_9AGAR|nr:hypothetical protein BD626DRAFT_630490 [Auriculariopsis ampla]